MAERGGRKLIVSRSSLTAVSEGRLKFNPEFKLKFGRYVVKKPKALVKFIGSEGEG